MAAARALRQHFRHFQTVWPSRPGTPDHRRPPGVVTGHGRPPGASSTRGDEGRLDGPAPGGRVSAWDSLSPRGDDCRRQRPSGRRLADSHLTSPSNTHVSDHLPSRVPPEYDADGGDPRSFPDRPGVGPTRRYGAVGGAGPEYVFGGTCRPRLPSAVRSQVVHATGSASARGVLGARDMSFCAVVGAARLARALSGFPAPLVMWVAMGTCSGWIASADQVRCARCGV